MRMKTKKQKEQYDISVNDVDASAMFSVFTKVRGAGSHTHKKCGFRLGKRVVRICCILRLLVSFINSYHCYCPVLSLIFFSNDDSFLSRSSNAL